MKRYRTVFVDWSSTLSHSVFWSRWSEKSHPQNNTYNAIQKFLFAPPYTLLNDWMRGKYLTEDIMRKISTATESDYDLLFDELIVSSSSMKISSPEILGLIKNLRAKGTEVVLATDNMDCFTRWTVPSLHLDTLFDDMLNSAELHALKGDLNPKGKSKFFENYLTKHKLKDGESVLIDNSARLREVIVSSGIEFLHVTDEDNALKHLSRLVACR